MTFSQNSNIRDQFFLQFFGKLVNFVVYVLDILVYINIFFILIYFHFILIIINIILENVCTVCHIETRITEYRLL